MSTRIIGGGPLFSKPEEPTIKPTPTPKPKRAIKKSQVASYDGRVNAEGRTDTIEFAVRPPPPARLPHKDDEWIAFRRKYNNQLEVSTNTGDRDTNAKTLARIHQRFNMTRKLGLPVELALPKNLTPYLMELHKRGLIKGGSKNICSHCGLPKK